MLSLIAFILVNGYMVYFLNQYMVRAKNPVNSRQMLSLEGVEAFLVLLFATGTMAMSSEGGGQGAGGGFNLQAIRLLLLEAFCVWGCVRSVRPVKWGIGMVAYLVFMLWCLYSMTYSQAGQYGWRYILKYIYPLLVMCCTASVVRDEEVFVLLCVWTRRVALMVIAVGFVPAVNRMLGGLFWYGTGLNMHYNTVVCISLTLYFLYGKDKKDLLLSLLFFLPSFVEVHRTGLGCIFVSLGVYCFYKFKLVSLPYIIGAAAIALAIVFYVPAFREKMFWNEETRDDVSISSLREGGISKDDIRNNGREAVWDMLKHNFYEGHELTGSGIGSCQKCLYEGEAIVKQVHGDYVQIKCDTGDIGFVLWFVVLGCILVHCFIETLRPGNPEYIKYCAMIAAAAVAGNYVAMYSDNCVTYTMTTTGYSFGFYGIMMGLKAKLTHD